MHATKADVPSFNIQVPPNTASHSHMRLDALAMKMSDNSADVALNKARQGHGDAS
ncbi:MAG: hypothetical protein Q7T21_06690 [Gallionella sp.]|nr:hypothetical protein [Gallionella sp.]